MSHYLMRSGRLVKFFTKSFDVFTVVDCENGFSSWRLSTPIVKVSIKVDGDLVGFTAQTESGSTYEIMNYREICPRTTLDKYIEQNTDLSHYIIIPLSEIRGE